MERLYSVTVRVTCKTQDILNKLRENREKHSLIYKEARIGYLEESKNLLKKTLNALNDNKLVPLKFNLVMPVNHLSAYDTVIKMLEMHQGDTIELSADEVRQFIEDKWEWKADFVKFNSSYSKLANDVLNSFNDGEAVG